MIRNLAIKLACLNTDDLNWFLNKIPKNKVEEIYPLIQEAKELGLNQDINVRKKLLSSPFILENKNKASELDYFLKQHPYFNQLNSFWRNCLLTYSDLTQDQKVIEKRVLLEEDMLEFNLPEKLVKAIKESCKSVDLHKAIR